MGLGDVLPGIWRRHAEKLRRSAELLWAPMDRALTLEPPWENEDLELWDHSYAFLLVAGAAIEAMLKAAAIHAHMNVDGFKQILQADGRTLAKWVTTHNLVSLAERAGLDDLAQDEVDQLRRFETYVVWAGSYPSPKNITATDPIQQIRFHYRVSNLDRVWFERLYSRAEARYLYHLEEMKKKQQT